MTVTGGSRWGGSPGSRHCSRADGPESPSELRGGGALRPREKQRTWARNRAESSSKASKSARCRPPFDRVAPQHVVVQRPELYCCPCVCVMVRPPDTPYKTQPNRANYTYPPPPSIESTLIRADFLALLWFGGLSEGPPKLGLLAGLDHHRLVGYVPSATTDLGWMRAATTAHAHLQS
jgi:hypothetical protein